MIGRTETGTSPRWSTSPELVRMIGSPGTQDRPRWSVRSGERPTDLIEASGPPAAATGRMDGSSQDRHARCFDKALAKREASMDGPAEGRIDSRRVNLRLMSRRRNPAEARRGPGIRPDRSTGLVGLTRGSRLDARVKPPESCPKLVAALAFGPIGATLNRTLVGLIRGSDWMPGSSSGMTETVQT